MLLDRQIFGYFSWSTITVHCSARRYFATVVLVSVRVHTYILVLVRLALSLRGPAAEAVRQRFLGLYNS